MATHSFGSHLVITGGTFTQVNNNLQERLHTPWDRLQAAAAPSAFHNSAERFDSPRCHPNTRVAVMIELRDLALRWGDVGKARILWLSGPAGAGKSAIAQSFCEECFATHFLLASFFFNRSDSSRNNAKSFVATLAYQIYGRVPTYQRSLILSVIEDDPLVFERSIDAQFKALIMDPLRDLFTAGYFDNTATARLIVIDGLDECSGAPVQVSILNALKNLSMQSDSPFVFVVASRPEHDIQMFFRYSSLGDLFHQLNLDNSYCPDADIELLLKEKIQETCATHPLKDSIPQEWPSSKTIKDLVQKSSGQFIYASVVIKYVTSNRHYPPNRLDIVLRLRPAKRDLPFAELDALYSHIFACVDDITLVLRILCIVIIFRDRNIDIPIKDIEQLCQLDKGECLSALCDLQSVLQVDNSWTIRLLHKSLPDYLQDPSRSHKYHIDTTPSTVTPLAAQCFRLISDTKLGYSFQCQNFISAHLSSLVSNIHLFHKDLMSFSLIKCWQAYYATTSKWGDWNLKEAHRNRLPGFTMGFFDELCTLQGTAYEHIWYHHLHQFPQIQDLNWELIGPTGLGPRLLNIYILAGNSDIHIPSKAIELGEQFGVPSKSDKHGQSSPDDGKFWWMHQHPAVCCSTARRCINSLMHDSSPKSAAFTLEWICAILPSARLSPELYEACLPRKPFAYAATGDHGLSSRARSACTAMQKYRERYAKEKLAVAE